MTAERERISAIVNAEAAKGREAAALKLALNANALPAEAAIEALEALPGVSSARGPQGPRGDAGGPHGCEPAGPDGGLPGTGG